MAREDVLWLLLKEGLEGGHFLRVDTVLLRTVDILGPLLHWVWWCCCLVWTLSKSLTKKGFSVEARSLNNTAWI